MIKPTIVIHPALVDFQSRVRTDYTHDDSHVAEEILAAIKMGLGAWFVFVSGVFGNVPLAYQALSFIPQQGVGAIMSAIGLLQMFAALYRNLKWRRVANILSWLLFGIIFGRYLEFGILVPRGWRLAAIPLYGVLWLISWWVNGILAKDAKGRVVVAADTQMRSDRARKEINGYAIAHDIYR